MHKGTKKKVPKMGDVGTFDGDYLEQGRKKEELELTIFGYNQTKNIEIEVA